MTPDCGEELCEVFTAPKTPFGTPKLAKRGIEGEQPQITGARLPTQGNIAKLSNLPDSDTNVKFSSQGLR
jgi:hypothetical protein